MAVAFFNHLIATLNILDFFFCKKKKNFDGKMTFSSSKINILLQIYQAKVIQFHKTCDADRLIGVVLFFMISC